jgi:hypothetical protein
MSVQMGGNAEGFGYHSLSGAPAGGGQGDAMAHGVGVSPHPGIGSSMNYVQGLQHESRNATFRQGQQEGKGGGPGMGSSKGSSEEEGAEGEGDAAAESTAETAGEGIAEDAAMIAV